VDRDGLKVYTVSADGRPVDRSKYADRLAEVKSRKAVDWRSTPGFVIMHEGASAPYLVLAWWGNANELFTSVSVKGQGGWIEDPSRYSFCLWDLEIIWHERNAFVDLVYRDAPDMQAYRDARYCNLVG